MRFAKAVRGREISYITKILNVFGIVEQRQLMALFSHLGDNEYGTILSRLNSEGHICWSRDGGRIAASRLIMGRSDDEDRILCFWAFIGMKDEIEDFCAGTPPELISFVTAKEDCVLVPLNGKNADAVNAHAAELPEETIRFLVAGNERDTETIDPRCGNDYVVLVGESGKTELYEF